MVGSIIKNISAHLCGNGVNDFYSENNVRTINSGDFQGQREKFTTFLKVIEGDVLKVHQEQTLGHIQFLPTARGGK
jgi:hypothetical protein